MTAPISTNAPNGTTNGAFSGVSLNDLPKTNTFTSNLPSDSAFKTPSISHKAPRDGLGPRIVKGALYTYVRPEKADEPELLSVSPAAMHDIGMKKAEDETEGFKQFAAGNKIFWDEKTEEGVYPWAQCYGAISLFETTNPTTSARYELQVKGAGRTPYSRFADGKAVLRSSIREYVVSEALNGLHIPSTRALSLTLLPKSRVVRERLEPGAIVVRFAQSWLRIGTYDILRARGDRNLIRQLSDYVAENVYAGWSSLPSAFNASKSPSVASVPKDTIQGSAETEENRYTRLYRAIVRRNALTVAAWQACGFMNGVLNTDNTSLLGLSLDFGPFAFLDNFDPSYTPNHDDHMLRYSYKNQPSVIWWNLVRLGESMGELIGAGSKVDDETFISKGVTEDFAPELIKRAETLIQNIGEEYKAVFMTEYKRLMRARLGLKSEQDSDFDDLFSELLDTLEAAELDFNHFFRRLSSLRPSDLETEDQCKAKAPIFFHKEGVPSTATLNEEAARERMGKWLRIWAERVKKDWGTNPVGQEEREKEMKGVNPKFVPRSWILDEIIRKVEFEGEREVLTRVMRMATNPFQERWADGNDKEAIAEEERWCGDVPREGRGMQCSCSS
ncbi:uncharacterized protein KY384_000207 [Bacidia gigantensis]|uniref:uncharacterized protein n=1 Tax=Bacidia gigantensis TaxID=2732470 RepID=UPI001D04E90C|nr:uncharacterized protein KY384_000207 [Bacidia gigantensis]KAG8526214.1 hypothetical protein KY384_000207 [Bacidia gigantensis]